MQDLRLIGVHEDGLHLLLAGPDGEHFTVPIDDALRTAARRDRPRMGQLRIDIDGGLRPREVQALVRAGSSTEEVADRAGWSVDKVRRYEGPILAERAHIADQARMVRMRHRAGSSSGPGGSGASTQTLQGRVAQRMRERGVDPDTNTWDAWRAPDATSWTVALTFAAGGRQRQATWVFDPVLRSAEARDDEARWLSADETPSAGPLPASAPRAASVYDVEAEGGVAATTTRRTARDRAAAVGGAESDEPVDLMTAMRQRTTVGRRSGRRRAEPRAHVAPALPLDGADAPEVEADSGMPSMPQAPAAQPELSRSEPAHHEPAHHEPALPGELAELAPAGATIPAHDDELETAPEPLAAQPAEDPADLADLADLAEPAAAPVEVDQDDEGPVDEPVGGRPDAPTAGPDETPSAEPTRPPTAKRKTRTSVPSWDDIMFGAKRD